MKSKWTSLLLCIFLGWAGAHRFYERKIATGILWLCTFGVLGLGWIFDLWILLIKPNKPITESQQYNTYLKVVEALQKNGCTVNEYQREWCIISANVRRGSVYCGHIFVVADPQPGFLSHMIGMFFPQYAKFRYEETQYGNWRKIFEMLEKRFARNGYDFNSYYYWPEDSLVAGAARDDDKPSGDKEWLNILKSVIERV